MTPTPGAAQSDVPPVPPGFQLITEAPGILFYRKDYPSGSPDWVQVINLRAGAGLEPLHGNINGGQDGGGVFGGSNARLSRRSLQSFWQEFSSQQENPFCITNGQFFLMAESPGPMPFPLKKDGQIITEGYDDDNEKFDGKRLLLELWPDRADITLLSQESLYNSTAPDIIGGLAEDAPKNIKKYVGRTFFGIDDRNGDGAYEIVLVFSTRSARQKDAAEVLRSFGAEKIMMLDGGGSTQLLCQSRDIIYSERLIPQSIGIYAAPDWPPPEEPMIYAAESAPPAVDAPPSEPANITAVAEATNAETPPTETAAAVAAAAAPASEESTEAAVGAEAANPAPETAAEVEEAAEDDSSEAAPTAGDETAPAVTTEPGPPAEPAASAVASVQAEIHAAADAAAEGQVAAALPPAEVSADSEPQSSASVGEAQVENALPTAGQPAAEAAVNAPVQEAAAVQPEPITPPETAASAPPAANEEAQTIAPPPVGQPETAPSPGSAPILTYPGDPAAANLQPSAPIAQPQAQTGQTTTPAGPAGEAEIPVLQYQLGQDDPPPAQEAGGAGMAGTSPAAVAALPGAAETSSQSAQPATGATFLVGVDPNSQVQGAAMISLRDLVWVPATMLPIAGLVFLLINKQRLSS